MGMRKLAAVIAAAVVGAGAAITGVVLSRKSRIDSEKLKILKSEDIDYGKVEIGQGK